MKITKSLLRLLTELRIWLWKASIGTYIGWDGLQPFSAKKLSVEIENQNVYPKWRVEKDISANVWVKVRNKQFYYVTYWLFHLAIETPKFI